MPFNSIEYLALYLPLTLAGFYLLSLRFGHRYIIAYLTIVSVVFYLVGSRRSLPILISSVVLNYLFAKIIYAHRGTFASKLAVTVGVCINLGSLMWFKYTNFALDNLSGILGVRFEIITLFLPLGISFFTFKQIAYLVDVFREEIKPVSAGSHALAVVFFPQLIAGPITLHRDFCRQLTSGRLGRFATGNFLVGVSIFAVGLFKRTVIADSAAPYSDAVFDQTGNLDRIDCLSAWTAALCYTLQLYFDFSGYSDMAVGSARMFGLRLPTNFYSPLKSSSIIEYWRRWHITLLRVIGRYVFQPLVIPLSRFCAEKKLGRWASFGIGAVIPTLLTFVLSGLWHGAGWTFILWGLLHGVYVSINEAWRLLNRKRRGKTKTARGLRNKFGNHLLTLAAVFFANVLFRSDRIDDAAKIWSGMFRLAELPFQSIPTTMSLGMFLESPLLVLTFGYGIVFLFPNTNQFFHKFASVTDRHAWDSADKSIVKLKWSPSPIWAAALGLIFCMGVVFMLRVQTNFIYFNF